MMQNVYLVSGRISKTEYMGDERKFDNTKLVYAESMEEAKEKYKQYWENKTSEYSVYYYVQWCDAEEPMNHINWQRQETQPEEFENRPLIQFIWITGVAENEFNGKYYFRDGWGICRISNSPDNILGYNREDINRIMKKCDMDLIDKVTHWSPGIVNYPK